MILLVAYAVHPGYSSLPILALAVLAIGSNCLAVNAACSDADVSCNPLGLLFRRHVSPFLPTNGRVKSSLSINSSSNPSLGIQAGSEFFGRGVAVIGDVDGDGIADVAVGGWGDDNGGQIDDGAVWILFMGRDGSIRSFQQIGNGTAGFTGSLIGGDYFGTSVTALGDIDGDGVPDIAVGAPKTGDGGLFRGGVWVIRLNRDGTVKGNTKISSTSGGFGGTINNGDQFGTAIAAPGDLDGDGIADLIVGAFLNDDGGTDRGAIWLVYLQTDGTVKSQTKISNTAGNFTGTLANLDQFGSEVAYLGDVDGDGIGDIAVGAGGADDGAANVGAVWILFMNSNGTVKTHSKISMTSGGFTGTLLTSDAFAGAGMIGPGDLDVDGVPDLIVGAVGDSDGGASRGALYTLFLNRDGSVKAQQKVSSLAGNFGGPLNNSDLFGAGIASFGDLDGDRVPDLLVGASNSAGGTGALWVLFLQPK